MKPRRAAVAHRLYPLWPMRKLGNWLIWLLRILQVGALVAFAMALFHPHGAVQVLGGAQGIVLRSTPVLILAPVVLLNCQIAIFFVRDFRNQPYRQQRAASRREAEHPLVTADEEGPVLGGTLRS